MDMIDCLMTKVDFAEWLNNVLSDKEIKPVELARMARIDPGVVTRILKAERSPRPKTIEAIARALKLPLETVFRAAGLLPPQSPQSELISRIIHLTSELPEEDQTEILEYAQLRHRLAEERGKNATQGSRKTTTKPKQV